MREINERASAWVVFVSAAVGGLIAVLSDISLKEDASAILKIHSGIRGVLRVHWFEPYMAAMVILAIALFLCVVFQKELDTGPKAFYLGVSVLSIIMTLTPYRQPNSIPIEKPPAVESSPTLMQRKALPLVLRPSTVLGSTLGQPLPISLEGSREVAKGGLHIRLTGLSLPPVPQKANLTKEVTINYFSPQTHWIFASSKIQATVKPHNYAGQIDIHAARPFDDFGLTVEVEGYCRVVRNIKGNSDKGEPLEIKLEPSNLSLKWQRALGWSC